MTFWADRLNYRTRPIAYYEVQRGGPSSWEKRPGNQERLENLIWARDQLGGVLRSVIINAVDPNASPREIARAHVNEKLVMRIVALDEISGHFTAEAVE